MTDPAAALLDSPALPHIVERLQKTLDDEAARRARFRDEVTPEVKAEFINGEVVMHSPARARHIQATLRLATLLNAHVQVRGLGSVYMEKALVALTRNDYEPDVCFFGPEKTTRIVPDTLEFPAPDLAVEILSDSTAARDRGIKSEDYASHGVAEYWIVDPEAETVEQYAIEDGAYVLRTKSARGPLESFAVEGFAIPVRALFDDTENLAALRALLA